MNNNHAHRFLRFSIAMIHTERMPGPGEAKGKILKRCSVCRKYGAQSIIVDPKTKKKTYYCYRCWVAIFVKPSFEKDKEEGQ